MSIQVGGIKAAGSKRQLIPGKPYIMPPVLLEDDADAQRPPSRMLANLLFSLTGVVRIKL